MGSGIIRLLLLLLFMPFLVVAQEVAVPWSDDLQLSWKDFKGPPEKNSRIAAVTASGISYKFSSHERDGYFEVEYEVDTFFYPEQSWYQPHMCDDLVLSHEQLHFDISELFARKMRRQMAETRFTSNVKKEVRTIYQRIIKELSEFQDLYDKETDFSRNREAQLRWNKEIAAALSR